MLSKENLQIIAALRKNARRSLVDVSNDIGIPHSTIHQKVREYENKIIKKHTSIIDFQKIGFLSHCFLLLKVPQEHKASLKNYILEHKNLNSLYNINTGYDFLLECVFNDISAQKEFLVYLSTQFHVELQKIDVLSPLVQENFLTQLDKFRLVDLL
jgi:DNA-binding Lrp family transcriptional regulator